MPYVVYECGEYEVCTEYDLDTFFAGTREENIIAIEPESRDAATLRGI